jgi:hypothetical protein
LWNTRRDKIPLIPQFELQNGWHIFSIKGSMKTLAITCLSALALQVAIQINKTEPNIVEEITVCRSKRVASLSDTTKVMLTKDSVVVNRKVLSASTF